MLLDQHPPLKTTVWNRDWQTFSVKGQLVNILDFVGLMVSMETTQLCCCSRKAAIDSMQKSGHGGYVSTRLLCFLRQTEAWIWPTDLPTLDLESGLSLLRTIN